MFELSSPLAIPTRAGEALPGAGVSDADEPDQGYHHGRRHEETAETWPHCREYPGHASGGVGETHRSGRILEGTICSRKCVCVCVCACVRARVTD